MRIAVLADIHGNIRALDGVRADIAKRSPDLVINLGDSVSGPLQASETADRLMNESYIHVRGNHDRQLIDLPIAEMGLSDQVAREQLDSRQLSWLASLPPSRILDDEIFVCHGSPGDDRRYLLEDVIGDRMQLTSLERIQTRLGSLHASLVLCGHSHTPRTVVLPGGMTVVNPGSVGLPAYDSTGATPHYVETGSPHARYAVIDWENKAVTVSFIAVEYDWESASREAAQANRPDWAYALATGYALKGF